MSINDISKSNLCFSFEIIFEKLIRKGKNKKIKRSLEINTTASELKKYAVINKLYILVFKLLLKFFKHKIKILQLYIIIQIDCHGKKIEY